MRIIPNPLRALWSWFFHNRSVLLISEILEEVEAEVKDDIRLSRWDEHSERRAKLAVNRVMILLKIRLDLPRGKKKED